MSETSGITDAFARVRDEIARVIDKLGLFKGEAANAADASEDAGNSVGRFFGDVLTVLLDALAVIIRGVTDLAIALAWVLKFIGVPEALALVWDALLVVKNGIEALIAGVWWVIDAIWALDAAATDGTRALIGMFDIDLFAQGQAMLQSFIDGFMSKVGELQGAITGALSDLRDLLPFSDAKEGPLADLTASGQAIVDTLAAGIRQAGGDVLDRALQVELAGVPAMPDLQAPTIPPLGLPNLDAISAMMEGLLANLPDFDALTAPLPVGPAPQPATAGAGDGGAREFTITIDRIEIIANGGDPEQIAAGVEDALARQVRALVEEADTRVRV